MKRLLSIVTALMLPLMAHAATVEITGISGNWVNVNPNNTVNLNGVGTSSINWGTSLGSGQSGYDFVAETTPFSPAASPFDIGTFTHRNITIAGSPTPASISSADLDLSVSGNVLADDGFTILDNFVLGGVFSFDHNETPNGGNCPVGSPPCPDIVTYLGAASFDSSISVDGADLFLTITGFTGLNTIGDQFITLEGQNNTATLQAAFTVNPTTIDPVPLPAGVVLMGTGLAAFGVWGRKKKRQA